MYNKGWFANPSDKLTKPAMQLSSIGNIGVFRSVIILVKMSRNLFGGTVTSSLNSCSCVALSRGARLSFSKSSENEFRISESFRVVVIMRLAFGGSSAMSLLMRSKLSTLSKTNRVSTLLWDACLNADRTLVFVRSL